MRVCHASRTHIRAQGRDTCPYCGNPAEQHDQTRAVWRE